MAKNLSELSLFDIIPPSITDDKNIQAIIKSLDPELKSVSNAIREALIISRLDELPEPLIDLLAWQWHVDFYEPDLSLSVKRELVKNSISWHRIKGTPAAVEQLVSMVFGNGKVSEWFEYNGRPYFFRVAVDIGMNNTLDMSKPELAKLRRVIKCAQNARSWLEFITLINDMEDTASFSEEFNKSLKLDTGYYDYYPYISHDCQEWQKHDGTLIYGGAIEHGGIFSRNNFIGRKGFYAHGTRVASAVNIDDLVVSLGISSPFIDNYARREIEILRNNVFVHDGDLKRIGGVFTISMPSDKKIYFGIKNIFAEDAKARDISGELNIKFTPRHGGGFMRDAAATHGVKKYFDNLSGEIALRRMRRDNRYIRDCAANYAHDALPVAV